MRIPNEYIQAYYLLDEMVVSTETGDPREVKVISIVYDGLVAKIKSPTAKLVKPRLEEVKNLCLEYTKKRGKISKIAAPINARIAFDDLPIPELLKTTSPRQPETRDRYSRGHNSP